MLMGNSPPPYACPPLCPLVVQEDSRRRVVELQFYRAVGKIRSWVEGSEERREKAMEKENESTDRDANSSWQEGRGEHERETEKPIRDWNGKGTNRCDD